MADIEAHQSKLYSELAPVYDRVFGKIFYSRLCHVIQSLNIPRGAKLLELGVGTGTSFPAYPTHCQVTGIDLAPKMLARARVKILKNSWNHLKVMKMDALNLKFPDDTFDYIMAFHVVTVVPDPIKMMAEARRVCRPDGKIVVVNHFTSESPVLGSMTRGLDPLTRRLGWRTDLRLQPFILETGLHVEQLYKTSRLSLYTVVVGGNEKNGSAAFDPTGTCCPSTEPRAASPASNQSGEALPPNRRSFS